MSRTYYLVLAILLIQSPLPLAGNDGAGEIALGGIRLRQEHRVAMVSEKLFISKKEVNVDYGFLFLKEGTRFVVTVKTYGPVPIAPALEIYR